MLNKTYVLFFLSTFSPVGYIYHFPILSSFKHEIKMASNFPAKCNRLVDTFMHIYTVSNSVSQKSPLYFCPVFI